MRWLMLSSSLVLAIACGEPLDPCAEPAPGIICAVAGKGDRAFNGDGLPAHDTSFYLPSVAMPGPDERIYIVDFNNQRIRRIADSGVVETVVGSGYHYYASTGGPALESPLENPIDMAFDRDGRLIFVSFHDPRVLYVDDDDYLWSLAGTGDIGDSGDGGPAIVARFTELVGVLAAPDGSVYVSDAGAHRVRVIRADGTIHTVAGTGEPGYTGDGGPAHAAQLDYPTALAMDPDGRLYVADARNHAVRRVDVDGTIHTIAGTGERGFSGDGGPARAAQLHTPEGLAIMADGSVLISDWRNHRIRRIDSDGMMSTFAGTGEEGFRGDGGPAIDAMLHGPSRIHLAGDVLYVADQLNDCVRAISLP